MGRAELFTGFVKQALHREVESDNPLFAPDGVLAERDVRRITRGAWSSPWELPEAGVLIPKLADLAFGMQSENHGGASQVRVGYDQALRILKEATGKWPNDTRFASRLAALAPPPGGPR